MGRRHLDFTGKKVAVGGSEAAFLIDYLTASISANKLLKSFEGGSDIVWHLHLR